MYSSRYQPPEIFDVAYRSTNNHSRPFRPRADLQIPVDPWIPLTRQQMSLLIVAAQRTAEKGSRLHSDECCQRRFRLMRMTLPGVEKVAGRVHRGNKEPRQRKECAKRGAERSKGWQIKRERESEKERGPSLTDRLRGATHFDEICVLTGVRVNGWLVSFSRLRRQRSSLAGAELPAGTTAA